MTNQFHGSKGDVWGWLLRRFMSNHLTRIGKMKSAGCWLCRIVREARGEITDVLSAEIHGPVNSAGCEGMATTVTGAHHSGVRSVRSDDSVLPSAGARTCEANHKGIEGEHWASCARVRRCKEEHTLTECQSWGLRTIVESEW